MGNGIDISVNKGLVTFKSLLPQFTGLQGWLLLLLSSLTYPLPTLSHISRTIQISLILPQAIFDFLLLP